jgi:hypothetical protein
MFKRPRRLSRERQAKIKDINQPMTRHPISGQGGAVVLRSVVLLSVEDACVCVCVCVCVTNCIVLEDGRGFRSTHRILNGTMRHTRHRGDNIPSHVDRFDNDP